MSSPSREGEGPANGHLSDANVAAYLDRTLTGAQRDNAETHLAGCVECRQHVIETQRILRQVNRPRRLLVGGTLTAVAAAVVVLIVRPALDRPNADGAVRSGESVTTLAAYGPLGTVNRTGLEFVWSPDRDAESYRLTVTGADGSTVWSASGTDTLARLPDSIPLRQNARYLWVTDALLRDGTTRTTGLRQFDVR